MQQNIKALGQLPVCLGTVGKIIFEEKSDKITTIRLFLESI